MRGTSRGRLEVSAIPPMSLGNRLDFLIHYPYGCIEQTTSGVFPQVYLTHLLRLSPSRKEEVDKNIKAGIARVKLFQTAGGGFAYWPGQAEVNEWGTNYAGHFLLEAEKAGYSLPAELMQNWKIYQQTKARDWNGGDAAASLTQSYRLMLLALAGSPELGAMNRMRQRMGLDAAAQWNLATAYYLAGQREVAQQMTKTLNKDARRYREQNGTFGSTLRDQAVILLALSTMDRKAEATALVKTISDRLASEDQLTTQEIAYSMVAMARYTGQGSNSARVKFSWRLNGGKWEDVSEESPVWQTELAEVSKGKLELKNKGGAILYPRLILDGIPQQEDTTSAANGVAVRVSYTTLDGLLLDPAKIEQGTDFIAKVMVKNTGATDYEQMAITQIFPSGWEIHNTRLDGSGAGGVTPTWQDFRDDRVFTFYDLKRSSTKTFHVLLNASYQGRYYLPTVVTGAMYDPTIQGRQGGKWIQVVAAAGN
ncbi:MAG: hypothetical protein R3C61_19930 [Bacteroidia bacterium]